MRRSGSARTYVTLQDVAALAGVSAKSVSRVVNNQGEIRESTRQRIQAAIDQLGYRPNILARSLIHKRTNTLAAVAWGIDHFGPSRTITSVEQQADELGYSLILSIVREPEGHDPDRILDALMSRRVDGIIWVVPEVGGNHDWVAASALAELPPMVFLNAGGRPGATTIAVDNRLGGRQAAQHLIDQGRRKIGVVTGPLAWWEARERQAGWMGALSEAGLDISESLVAESSWSAAGGERAMQELLLREPSIDGVCAGSDQIALGALGAILAAGRRVPGDVAVVGFDDMPESAYFQPPLSTVHQNLSEAGRLAVQRLHETISGSQEEKGASGSTTFIEPRLVIRVSST